MVESHVELLESLVHGAYVWQLLYKDDDDDGGIVTLFSLLRRTVDAIKFTRDFDPLNLFESSEPLCGQSSDLFIVCCWAL